MFPSTRAVIVFETLSNGSTLVRQWSSAAAL